MTSKCSSKEEIFKISSKSQQFLNFQDIIYKLLKPWNLNIIIANFLHPLYSISTESEKKLFHAPIKMNLWKMHGVKSCENIFTEFSCSQA